MTNKPSAAVRKIESKMSRMIGFAMQESIISTAHANAWQASLDRCVRLALETAADDRASFDAWIACAERRVSSIEIDDAASARKLFEYKFGVFEYLAPPRVTPGS